MKTMFVVLAVILALSGCAATGVQVKPEQLTSFQTGITTEAEVVQVLGKPQTLMSSSDGTRILAYAFLQYQIKGASFIPIVGLFAGGSDMKTSSTVFTFDKAGKMLTHQTTESQYGSRHGLTSAQAR